MNNLDLYLSRLQDSGQVPQSRQYNNKVKTFKNALKKSYNTERVKKGERYFEALITSIPTSPIITKKNFSTLLENKCEIGDVVYWDGDKTSWMITEQDNTEKAIFQGSIQKCLYEIFWKDPDSGEVYSSMAAAKGPEETTITNGVKHSIFFDRQTDSIYLIVPQKIRGAHLLKRYFQLMVNGRKWEIEISDNMTREELLYIDLKEVPKDRELDTEDLVGGKVDDKLYLRTTIDDLVRMEKGLKATIDPVLIKNGQVKTREGFSVKVRNALCDGNEITFNQLGKARIIIEHKRLNFKKVFEIDVEEEVRETVPSESLIGSEKVRTLTAQSYEFYYSIDGEKLDVFGEWEVDENYFKIIEMTSSTLNVKVKNKTGTSIIKYINEGRIYEKEVKIVPVFGG